jgi:hypothetical protein
VLANGLFVPLLFMAQYYAPGVMKRRRRHAHQFAG